MREYAKKFRACLHGGGGPQVGEVTRLGEVTCLSIKSLILTWSRLHDRWGDPPHVTSHIGSPPPPCKQALIPWWMSCTFLKSICKKKHLSAEKQAYVFKKFYEEVRLSRTWKYFEWIIKQLLNSAFAWRMWRIMQNSEAVGVGGFLLCMIPFIMLRFIQ